MALEDDLGLDYLTKLVNVQWESGLAVEFFDNDGPPEEPVTA